MVSMHTGHSKRSLRNTSVEFWSVLEVAIFSFDGFVVHLSHLWPQIILMFGNKFSSDMSNDRHVYRQLSAVTVGTKGNVNKQNLETAYWLLPI